jgi:hypothetical protein
MATWLLESWAGRAAVLGVSSVATFAVVDAYRYRGAQVATLNPAAITSAMVDNITANHTVPSAEDVSQMGEAGTVTVARIPCRSPGLIGKADVVVRYHNATPAEIAHRVAARQAQWDADLQRLKETEAAEAQRPKSSEKTGPKGDADESPPTTKRQPRRSTQAGGWNWVTADRLKDKPSPTTAPAAGTTATAAAAPTVPTPSAADVKCSELKHLVPPPERPLVSVASRVSTWDRTRENLTSIKEAIFSPHSTSAGWLKVNTAEDKLRSREWMKESHRLGGRTENDATMDANAAARTGALRYASVRIERTDAKAEGEILAAAPLGLVKCDVTTTPDAATQCRPDAMALPSVIGRLFAGSAALLPFPLPTHCRVAVVGLDTPALPVFIDTTFYKNLTELHVVDAEPALLEAAVEYAGLVPFNGRATDRRFQLHATRAEDFLLREENKMDLLLVNMTAGGEAAENLVRELGRRRDEAAAMSNSSGGSAVSWGESKRAVPPSPLHTLDAFDARYSQHFAKLCWSTLSSAGVAAFALDDRKPEECDHFTTAVERSFGRENVFELSARDTDGDWVRVLLAAKQLPTNGMSGRHLAARYRRLSGDYRWPFDASAHLPASYLVW